MKLLDAIKQQGDPFYIPNCTREDLPALFKELGFKVGAEIGVSWGMNMETYLKAGFQMYGIDPYQDYEDEHYRPISYLARRKIPTTTIEDIYNLAMKKLSPYPNFTMIRKTSMEALADIPKRSLDFVYIDGNHKFGYVAMDLMKWSDKVKRHGVIAGHDYYCLKGSRQTRQVGPVVDAFMKSFDITNWYVLGTKHPSLKDRTDDALSFMCFKHW